MLSPDGQWVWDGSQWQPIARHESVFPSWQSAVAVEPAAAVPAPVAAASPMPAVVQPVNPAYYPQAQPAARGWGRQPGQSGINYPLYFVAGAIGIVIILVVLNSVFPLWLLLPGPKPPPPLPSPKASPLPALTQRSDYARADRFVNVVLPAALQDFSPAATAVSQQCSKQLTISCQNDLTAIDPLFKNVLAAFDKNSVPLCISAPAAKARSDIAAMQSAVTAAEKAYNDNQASELAAATGSYRNAQSALGRDLATLAAVTKSSCDTRETGP